MLVATNVSSPGNIIVADCQSQFPNVSFPPSGPTADWLADNDGAHVMLFLPHDPNTQRLAPAVPYLQGGVVYTMVVQDLSAEELAAVTAMKEAEAVAAVQRLLDSTAKQRGYDGILSACSYATSANAKFGAEGKAAVAWRDEVWAACYATLGTSISTTEALLATLPVISWPA